MHLNRRPIATSPLPTSRHHHSGGHRRPAAEPHFPRCGPVAGAWSRALARRGNPSWSLVRIGCSTRRLVTPHLHGACARATERARGHLDWNSGPAPALADHRGPRLPPRRGVYLQRVSRTLRRRVPRSHAGATAWAFAGQRMLNLMAGVVVAKALAMMCVSSRWFAAAAGGGPISVRRHAFDTFRDSRVGSPRCAQHRHRTTALDQAGGGREGASRRDGHVGSRSPRRISREAHAGGGHVGGDPADGWRRSGGPATGGSGPIPGSTTRLPECRITVRTASSGSRAQRTRPLTCSERKGSVTGRTSSRPSACAGSRSPTSCGLASTTRT